MNNSNDDGISLVEFNSGIQLMKYVDKTKLVEKNNFKFWGREGGYLLPNQKWERQE